MSDSSRTDDEFNFDEDSTQTRRRRRSKQQKRQLKGRAGPPSATQRMRQSTANDKQIEDITGNHLIAIANNHVCKVATCRNYGKPCVPMGQLGHLFVTSTALKKWNNLIRDGQATVHDCPGAVVADLVNEKSRAEHNKAQSAAASRGGDVVGGLLGGGASLIINPSYFGGGGSGGPGVVNKAPESSPPQRPGDDDQNMKDYMLWLGQKYPNSAYDFRQHSSKLGEYGWGFSDLRLVKEEDWKDMKINAGFVRKIQKHIKEFVRAEGVVIHGSGSSSPHHGGDKEDDLFLGD